MICERLKFFTINDGCYWSLLIAVQELLTTSKLIMGQIRYYVTSKTFGDNWHLATVPL